MVSQPLRPGCSTVLLTSEWKMQYLIQQTIGIMMVFLISYLTSPEITAVLSCPVKTNKKKPASLHSWYKEAWNCFGDIFASTEMEQQMY